MIRPALPDDMRFVTSSWLKSFANSDFARLLTPNEIWERHEASDAYYDAERIIIAACLERSVTLIADTPGMIDGWLVCEPGILHYAYVRQSARGRGVARALMSAAGITRATDIEYTHRSRGLTPAKVPKLWRYAFWRLLAPASGKAA